MSLSGITPYHQIQPLTFNRVEENLRSLRRTCSLPDWHNLLEDFSREHKIAPELLAFDGRRCSIPEFADVVFHDNHRFAFQREHSEPAVAHRAIIYNVGSRYGDVIDLVAIVPSVNRAAHYLGTRGVLGFRRFTHRGAKRGVRLYRDPMQYLADGRNGVLIVDPVMAAAELRGKLLIVDTKEHALELDQLGLDIPPVIIRPLWRRR